MKPILIIAAIILTISSCQRKQDLIKESIITKLDSLMQIQSCGEPDCMLAKQLEYALIDSLYDLDSTDYQAIVSKFFMHNEKQEFEESMIYGRKVLCYDSLQDMHAFYARLFTGWYLESQENLDSAKIHYEKILDSVVDWDEAMPWVKPQIELVLRGQQAALISLKEIKLDISSIFYKYVENDVVNYQNDGLLGCFPLSENGVEVKKFALYIPENIYDDSLNTMDKVSMFFTNQGVNVQKNAHYPSERMFVIKTLPKYVEKLKEISPFKLEVVN
ncbi:hypothetical protein [Marinoscillum pacificum]|uniref:hypothetical protein n=1 Tax=Marinoscillum pacificum TaxID=392723 RepID=UPI0021578CF4|nr:hypothetical protein [Marinoscillum pacificum]